MGFYDRYILPKLLNWSCGAKPVRAQRQKVVPLAEGRVLEIGIGSGLNLPYYDPGKVERVIGLDPAEEMLSYARRRSATLPFAVEYLALEGECIPLDRHSVDTVLVTYTLCTIADAIAALEGMRAVLKPAGRLIFCEHGRAPDAAVRRWQHRLNPLWGRIGGGCNLDRDIPALIEGAGFRVDSLESGYLPRTPRFAGFNYWGSAVPG
jgi:ubiquinone/menaquinone biosynthesis C-methylase UbiE